jgi:hypothetical protein
MPSSREELELSKPSGLTPVIIAFTVYHGEHLFQGLPAACRNLPRYLEAAPLITCEKRCLPLGVAPMIRRMCECMWIVIEGPAMRAEEGVGTCVVGQWFCGASCWS